MGRKVAQPARKETAKHVQSQQAAVAEGQKSKLQGREATLLNLQRTHGNRHVTQNLKGQMFNGFKGGILQRQCSVCGQAIVGGECVECGMTKGRLQQKLRIGASNNPLELEADRVADQVMSASARPGVSSAPLRIQRFTGQSTGKADMEAPASVNRVLSSPGSPLEPTLKQDMEQRFGHNFSHVRVHTDAAAGQSAQDVNANAYTVGHHVVFGAGRFAPGTHEGKRLISHELTHVVQQSYEVLPAILSRTPDPHQPNSSRAVPISELHDLLIKLLTSLKRKTQLSIMGFKTIAIGLVEGIDEKGEAFETLVYTASGNWGSLDLEMKAAALGITRWNARARGEGRGPTGAPEDAEQLMIEGQDQADMKLLGMAVSRNPCLDCAEAIRDEDVQSVFVDPSKHLPKREHRRKSQPSADLERARAEIALAFAPQLVAVGQEVTVGFGPESSVWAALNVLDMKELYQVLEESDRAGRLSTLMAKAPKAKGVFNDRLLAPMDAITLKKENLKQNPDRLNQSIIFSILKERLGKLPPDQSKFILNQLYPKLRLAVPPKQTTPTKQREQPSKPTFTTLGELVKKGLTAAGIVLTVVVLVELIEAIATAIFLEVAIAGAAQLLKGGAGDKVKEIVTRELKNRIGTKIRVEISPKQIQQAAENVYHEVEPFVESALKVMGH